MYISILATQEYAHQELCLSVCVFFMTLYIALANREGFGETLQMHNLA